MKLEAERQVGKEVEGNRPMLGLRLRVRAQRKEGKAETPMVMAEEVSR
jgi:hypothetical protein